MRRHHLLLAILLAGAVATLWFLRPRPADGPEPSDCSTASECELPIPAGTGGGEAQPEPPSSSPETPATPAPETSEAAPRDGHGERGSDRPLTVADGVRLREDYERLMAEKRVPEAIEALRRATEADPSASNHGELGSLLAKLTAFDEAARHLRAAAELDAGNADRWIALANVYYRKVDLGEAWAAERRAKEAEPGLVLGRDAEGMRIRAGAPPPPPR